MLSSPAIRHSENYWIDSPLPAQEDRASFQVKQELRSHTLIRIRLRRSPIIWKKNWLANPRLSLACNRSEARHGKILGSILHRKKFVLRSAALLIMSESAKPIPYFIQLFFS